MFIAVNESGYKVCARCGKMGVPFTKDHFIPKSCKMTVNEEGNYVGLCEMCNREKANKIVLPDWYLYLNKNQKERLLRYMRYARSYILANTTDEEILEVMRKL